MNLTKQICGAKLKNETEKAYFVSKNGIEAWIPKSQVKDSLFDNIKKNQYGRMFDTDIVFLEVPMWLANKDNLKGMLV